MLRNSVMSTCPCIHDGQLNTRDKVGHPIAGATAQLLGLLGKDGALRRHHRTDILYKGSGNCRAVRLKQGQGAARLTWAVTGRIRCPGSR